MRREKSEPGTRSIRNARCYPEMSQTNANLLSRLLTIGFRRAGCWSCVDGCLCAVLDPDVSGSTNFLYAFTVADEVKYIGKSVKSVRQRMQGYRKPSSTQVTNVRNNRSVLDAIGTGARVEIYVLPDNGLLRYGGFHINLAAGLEDSLIRELRPPWNGGRRSDGTIPVSES